MIWEAIAHGRLGPLFIFSKGNTKSVVYIDDILNSPFLYFYQYTSKERGRVKFIEDGTPIYNRLK
jgi:hypothetical protein